MKKIIIIIILLVILAIILFYPLTKPTPRPSIESFQVNLDTVADVKAARAAAHHAGYKGLSTSIPLTRDHTEPKIVLPTVNNSIDNSNIIDNSGTNNTTENTSTYNTTNDSGTYNTTENTGAYNTENTTNVNAIRF